MMVIYNLQSSLQIYSVHSGSFLNYEKSYDLIFLFLDIGVVVAKPFMPNNN